MKLLKILKKIFLFLLLALVGMLLFGEIGLRFLGFGNTVLYYNNDFTGYAMQPNQDRKVLGKRILTNEYSMRSEPLKEDEYRILVFGDSVLNGGLYTDHEKLATTMLERTLQETDPSVRVLNASCGGWGINNCWGVTEQYGDFDAKAVILVVNSHDAMGQLADYPVAGSLYYPDRQYRFAWQELFCRYILPRFNIYTVTTVDYTNIYLRYGLSEGWSEFLSLSQEKGIPLVIYLHAQKNELVEFGEYNYYGQMILDFAEENGIPIYTDLEQEKPEDFRDWIHLTEDGQQLIYNILLPVLQDLIGSRPAL